VLTPSHDSVTADHQDVVARDCENVARAGSGPGTSTRHGSAKLVLKGHPRLAKALRGGFSVRVSGGTASGSITLRR
jgi:hypothetical protein